jgi:hypothetical protein
MTMTTKLFFFGCGLCGLGAINLIMRFRPPSFEFIPSLCLRPLALVLEVNLSQARREERIKLEYSKQRTKRSSSLLACSFVLLSCVKAAGLKVKKGVAYFVGMLRLLRVHPFFIYKKRGARKGE